MANKQYHRYFRGQKGWKENLGKEFNQDYFKETFLKSVQINGVSTQKGRVQRFLVDLDKVRVV